jgi:DNA excision repair protein ERCC-8
MDFKMPGKVYTAAMSPVATTHMLIATGSADVQVCLCDIASGAFTHTSRYRVIVVSFFVLTK